MGFYCIFQIKQKKNWKQLKTHDLLCLEKPWNRQTTDKSHTDKKNKILENICALGAH